MSVRKAKKQDAHAVRRNLQCHAPNPPPNQAQTQDLLQHLAARSQALLVGTSSVDISCRLVAMEYDISGALTLCRTRAQ